MKNQRSILIILNIIISIDLFLFFNYNAAAADNEYSRIDSLIEIHKINDKCILLKFGPDAVCAINTNKGIVVIDAGISTGLTEKYKKIIEREFTSTQFIYVINTHAHPDHYGGNAVFPGAIIVGQINGTDEIEKQNERNEQRTERLKSIVNDYEQQLQQDKPGTNGWNYNFIQKTRYAYALMDAQNHIMIKKPELTFTDSIKISIGDFTFEMFYFGKCHSDSDILIYIPELSLLFPGDLFSAYGRTAINNDSEFDKEKSKKAVLWLENRMNNIGKIITGHGLILGPDDLKSFISIIINK